MYIFSRKIYAKNDFLVKLWAGAALLILAVFAVLSWNDRFRENIETSEAVFSPFGVEIRGNEAANFTGSRGFFAKMNKLGLGATAREYELEDLFAALGENAENGAGKSVPVLWIYAEGKTKEARDRCVQTFGKVFFASEKLCFSIADAAGFSVQVDPQTFHVLWARDGGAICAIPLLQIPPETGKNGFVLRIEERGENGAWTRAGEVKFPPFDVPADEENAVPAENSETPENISADENSAKNPAEPDEFFPQEISAESLAFPRECRFFSAPLWDRSAFGKLRLNVRGDAAGKVPAAAWNLENLELRAENQTFPLARADALHRNVRFLDDEIFEEKSDGVLSVPVAKTLFPRNGEAWTLKMRFYRQAFFPQDFFTPPPLHVSKIKGAAPKNFEFAGTQTKIKAFLDDEYFRRLNNKIPALVVEIRQDAGGNATHFWEPFRVRSDAGEELALESVVEVEPGVRQYWFLPLRATPKKIELVCAVTRFFYAESEIVPEIFPAEK